MHHLSEAGILEEGKDRLKGCITIPVLDENKAPVSIVGYSMYPQKKERLVFLSDDGLFNAPFLRRAEEVILSDSPLHALALISCVIRSKTATVPFESCHPFRAKVATVPDERCHLLPLARKL